jgi:hypothetical protein
MTRRSTRQATPSGGPKRFGPHSCPVHDPRRFSRMARHPLLLEEAHDDPHF